jgi:hypothetical protein
VNVECLDTCSRADDDLGSGAGEGISVRKQSVQSSISFRGVLRQIELIGTYRSDILE